MHFVMHAFNNHVEVPHDVTPIDLLDQSAVLSDGVVVVVLHKVTPFVLLQQTAVLLVQTQRVSEGMLAFLYSSRNTFSTASC